MRRQAPKVWLSAEQQDELERFARSRTLAARCVERARILLGCAAGRENQQIGEELGVCRPTVGRWRERFVAQGMDGLEGSGALGTARTHPARQDGRDRTTHHPGEAHGGHPLEYPCLGAGSRGERRHGRTNLAGARLEATSGEELQAE